MLLTAMNSCPVLKLSVCRNGKENCNFFLIPNADEGEPLQANLEFPKRLIRVYENWQDSYLNARFLSPQEQAEKGSGYTPSSVDWLHESNGATKELLHEFHKWLGHGELLSIREKIQSEATRTLSKKRKGIENHQWVELLITCNTSELVLLPWEAWKIASKDAPLGTIRICRTLMKTGNERNWVEYEKPLRRTKARILAILADAPELDLLEDQRSVRLLQKVAKVEIIKRKSGEDSQEFKQRITDNIADERGWDVLIFAGHSEETSLTGGRLVLTPEANLSLDEIDSALITAKNRGLQVAIFNSCQGLRIAEYLIQSGLSQVVVMRERIHDQVAHIFLKEFCQSLTNYKDVNEAVLDACEYLKRENITFSGAYLIPSLFRHPSPKAELFRFEPSGLRRFWQDWKPTPREAIFLGIVLLLGLLPHVRSGLFDLRTGVQTFYRDQTRQLPQPNSAPVLLIAIDQRSVREASIETDKINPMDRRYLAKLIKQLSGLKARVIGLDYLLDALSKEDKALKESILSTVKQQGTWFVFADAEHEPGEMLGVSDSIASKKWSLQGDIEFEYYPFWNVKLPARDSCKEFNLVCPFAYVLAIAHILNQEASSVNVPQPQWNSSTDFQSEVVKYFNQRNEPDNKIASLKRAYLPLGLQPSIDFSIPSDQVYNRISAWEFLKLLPNDPALKKIEQQVVVIAPGGYEQSDEEKENFPVPLAVRYWRSTRNHDIYRRFTGGEAHAYMIHHLLSQHWVALIPDLWMIGIAVILGKGTSLILQKQKRRQQQQWAVGLGVATAAYGVVGLQVYIWASVSIPWFLPSFMFWIYVLLVLRRKFYA